MTELCVALLRSDEQSTASKERRGKCVCATKTHYSTIPNARGKRVNRDRKRNREGEGNGGRGKHLLSHEKH